MRTIAPLASKTKTSGSDNDFAARSASAAPDGSACTAKSIPISSAAFAGSPSIAMPTAVIPRSAPRIAASPRHASHQLAKSIATVGFPVAAIFRSAIEIGNGGAARGTNARNGTLVNSDSPSTMRCLAPAGSVRR